MAMKEKPNEMFKQLNNYIRTIHSFIINPNNNLNSYLHQILPTVLSVGLGKKLTNNNEDNHWELRKLAINLLFLICNQYKNTYPDLETRTINTFKHIIDDNNKYKAGPLYGALLGIRVFGALAIQKVLVTKFNDIHVYLQTLNESEDPVVQNEGRNCSNVFIECIYLYNQYARANNLDVSMLPNLEDLPNPEYIYNVMEADQKMPSHLSDINI